MDHSEAFNILAFEIDSRILHVSQSHALTINELYLPEKKGSPKSPTAQDVFSLMSRVQAGYTNHIHIQTPSPGHPSAADQA